MTVDREKLKLVGWLKKPQDITVNGKTIPQVVRILGNPEWGYLYEIKKGNKYFKTSEPLWHNEWQTRKRNDMPKVGQAIVSKVHGPAIVREYQGFGWYDAADAQGKKITLHFFDMQKE